MVTHILSMCSNGGQFLFPNSTFQPAKVDRSQQVPTFCLGFMTMHPAYRNNVVFAVTFFLTRILFHIVLGVSYFFHDNRAQATGGSYVPSLLLASIFPLHAMWFRACIIGFFRRASQRNTPISTTKAELEILPVDKVVLSSESQSKRVVPSRPSRAADNRHSARSTDSTASPKAYDTKLDRSKLQSRRLYFRSVSLTRNDSRSSVTGILRTKLYASLPNREVVFDYVGLGRASAQEQ